MERGRTEEEEGGRRRRREERVGSKEERVDGSEMRYAGAKKPYAQEEKLLPTILHCFSKDLYNAVILLISEGSGSSHKWLLTETLIRVT